MRHEPLPPDGFDIGWQFAAPVGCGGFPDDWFVGWMPLPDGPTAQDETGGDATRSEAERRDEHPSPETSALLAEAASVANDPDEYSVDACRRRADLIRRLSQALREAGG